MSSKLKCLLHLMLFVVYPSLISACCDEDIHRILPLGYDKEQIIFVEFTLFRTCLVEELNPGKGDKNEFWISGVIELTSRVGDSILFREAVDTIMHRECICNFDSYDNKSNYDEIMHTYFARAKAAASKRFNLKPIRARSISFNATKHVRIQKNKRSIQIDYKDLFSIHLKRKNILSAFPTELSEIRKYQLLGFDIIIVRLSSNKSPETYQKQIKNRFKKRLIPFWKETSTAHGTSKEYIKIIHRQLKK